MKKDSRKYNIYHGVMAWDDPEDNRSVFERNHQT